MADLLGLIGQGANAWQLRENYEDAQHAIDKGFKRARKDVKQYQEPYTDFGLEHMQAYNDMGEFSFSNEDFYRDPSYQWRLDQGMENTLRQQAAQKQVGSGNTLARLQELGQDMASQEYQAAYERAQGTYDTNRAYHQFPIETGAGMAKELGTNLAELGIGQAGSTASLHASLAEGQSRIISSTLANLSGGDAGAIGGIIDDAVSTFGGLTEDAVGWIAEKAGIDTSSVMSAITSAGGKIVSGVTGAGAAVVNKAGGALWGAFGSGPTKLATKAAVDAAAGTTATGATSATAAGFGTWAASVAGGFAVLGAIKLLNERLGGQPKIGKMFSNLSNKQDPLSRMFSEGFNETWSGEFASVLERDAAGGRSAGTNGTVAKGFMLSSIIQHMDDPSLIGQRDDADRIVNTMFSALGSGYQVDRKWAKPAGITGASEGLVKLFPDMAKDFERLENLSQNIRRNESYLNTSTDSWLNDQNRADSIRTMRENEIQLKAELRRRLNKKLAAWEKQRTIASTLEAGGVV
jgi:hypothetical protein